MSQRAANQEGSARDCARLGVRHTTLKSRLFAPTAWKQMQRRRDEETHGSRHGGGRSLRRGRYHMSERNAVDCSEVGYRGMVGGEVEEQIGDGDRGGRRSTGMARCLARPVSGVRVSTVRNPVFSCALRGV